MSTRRLAAALSVVVLLTPAVAVGCASPSPAPVVRDASGQAALQAAIARRDALDKQFTGAPASHQQACEFRAGDCRIEVSERRDSIVRSTYHERCRTASDVHERLRCELEELAATGDAKTSVAYYDFESRCLQQLVACAGELEKAAVTASRSKLRQQREERLQGSREGLQLRASVALEAERIAYLRALLPPNVEGACDFAERFASCEEDAQQLSSKLDAELDKPNAEYDEARALGAFAEVQGALASCYRPELECVSSELNRYGGNAETRRLIAQASDVLAERERLVLEAGERSKTCLSAGIRKHQTDIVQGYQRFAREPVMYFQAQLHRAFKSMYDTQVSCLRGLPRPAVASLRSTGSTTDSVPTASAKAPR